MTATPNKTPACRLRRQQPAVTHLRNIYAKSPKLRSHYHKRLQLTRQKPDPEGGAAMTPPPKQWNGTDVGASNLSAR
ncbi:MAG: hypothetical protein WBY01_10510, partial [Pseudolabrys sp.]